MTELPQAITSQADKNGNHTTYVYGIHDAYFAKLPAREQNIIRNLFLIKAGMEPLIMGVPKSTWEAMGEAQRQVLINDARFEGEHMAGMPTAVFDGLSPDQKITALQISQERNELPVAGIPSRIFKNLSEEQQTQAWKTHRLNMKLDKLSYVFKIAAISTVVSLLGYATLTAISGPK